MALWAERSLTMSQTKFDTNYDRSQVVTVEDVISTTGKAALLVNKAIKDSGLLPVGYVHTGRVGKPPRLFDRAAAIAAVDNYEEQRSVLRAAKASASKAKTEVVATVPPPANDNLTPNTPEALVFGE